MAVFIVNGFQFSIIAVGQQLIGKIDDQTGNRAALSFAQPLLYAGPIKAMNHPDLPIHQVIYQRQQFAGVFLLVAKNGGFPVSQLGAFFFNLFDQFIECLLSFGQFGLVVSADYSNDLQMSFSHGMIF